MSLEPLRELDKVIELVAEATQGPWEVSDHNEGEPRPLWCVDNEAFHHGDDDDQPLMVSVQYGGKSDALAIGAAVNFIRAHGPYLSRALAQLDDGWRDSLTDAVRMLLDSAPKNMCPRNAKEREAYKLLRALMEKGPA